MIKRKMFLVSTIPVIAALFILFTWISPNESQANMKFRKIHKAQKLTCKKCHHKPKKKCGNCHVIGAKKTTNFSKLPAILKKSHSKCRACHAAKGKKGIFKKVGKYVRSSSKCKLCH